MLRIAPGPERKKYLELCVAGLKRAERRIVKSRRMTDKVVGNIEGYTIAVIALRIKRSELAAELEGLPWEAKPLPRRLLLTRKQWGLAAENSTLSISRERISINSSLFPPPKTEGSQ